MFAQLAGAIRTPIEHISAYLKDKMGLFVRTIGLAYAKMNVNLANMAYYMRRLV